MATTTAASRAPSAAEAAILLRPPRSLWSNAWHKLRHDRLTMIAFFVLALLAVLAAGADLLADNVFHYTFEKQDLLYTYQKPTFDPPAFLLGSDEIGRSQVVRLLYGGRVSLMVGFVAAGYMRGRIDDLFTWFVTTLNSIPTIFLLLIFAAIWEPGPGQLTVVIGLLFWTGISLFCRGQTFALREREFVVAAKTIGARDARIMFKHILPNILPLIFVLAAIDIGAIILTESALSYLGLGILPPTPSWGNLLTNATTYFVRAWWLVVSPGVMIFVTVLCLYLIGDGLRDALDPRLRAEK
jgi:peptide/nickel transport system permease protein